MAKEGAGKSEAVLLDERIIMDYLGRPDVIPEVLIRRMQEMKENAM